MFVSGLDHYNLCAPRTLLDELCEFYRNVVGLELGERPSFAEFGYWLYAGGDPVLHLSEADSPRADTRNAGFNHAAFRCTDYAGTKRHLIKHGIEYRVARVPGTGIVQLFISDPAGNGIELNFDSDKA